MIDFVTNYIYYIIFGIIIISGVIYFFKKILLFLRINLNEILGITFGALLILFQFIFSGDWLKSYPFYAKVLVVFSFLVYITSQILNIKNNIDKRDLYTEVLNWRKEASILIETHIIGLSKKLSFGKDDNGFINRISIYAKDKKGFYCIGRYSDNVEYNKKSGKLYFNKGFILKARDNGNRNGKGLFDNKIPNPSKQKKNYVNYHKKEYGLNDEDMKNLHMKSRLYFGWRIDVDNKPLSLILFETTKNDKITHDELNQIFIDTAPTLKHILKFILPNLPKPYYDSNKKF